jgi:hypothetical protein
MTKGRRPLLAAASDLSDLRMSRDRAGARHERTMCREGVGKHQPLARAAVKTVTGLGIELLDLGISRLGKPLIRAHILCSRTHGTHDDEGDDR